MIKSNIVQKLVDLEKEERKTKKRLKLIEVEKDDLMKELIKSEDFCEILKQWVENNPKDALLFYKTVTKNETHIGYLKDTGVFLVFDQDKDDFIEECDKKVGIKSKNNDFMFEIETESLLEYLENLLKDDSIININIPGTGVWMPITEYSEQSYFEHEDNWASELDVRNSELSRYIVSLMNELYEIKNYKQKNHRYKKDDIVFITKKASENQLYKDFNIYDKELKVVCVSYDDETPIYDLIIVETGDEVDYYVEDSELK